MKQFEIKIEGLSPYMQHRMDDIKLAEWEKLRGKIMERPEVSIEDAIRAEYHCYRTKLGHCYIPSDHIRGALINAGTFMKAKVGGRSKSMKSIVAGQFIPAQDQIIIADYDAIDKRSAVNRNVKARVIVIRPKWNKWNAEFVLNVLNDSITKETVKELTDYAGLYVGIGSFRPQNSGMFGTFKVVDCKVI